MLAAMSLPPTTAPPGDETPVRGRADACPGALRLHPADDGALARVRLPAGLLTACQALVLALAAEELGDGRLDLTSRGNLQLRGLAPGCGAGLAARLRTAGLLPSDRHDRVRNIVASPLSGLDGAGHTDVSAWARELDALLCDDGPASSGFAELASLSGRFLFALDDGRGDVAALGADVTLIAEPDGGALLRLGSVGGHGLGYPASTAPDAGGSSEATGRPDASGVAARRNGRAVGDDTPGRARPLDPGPGGDSAVAGLRMRAADAPRAAALAAVAFLDAVRASGTRAWRVRELSARHAVTDGRLAGRLAEAGIQATPLGPESLRAEGQTSPVDAAPAREEAAQALVDHAVSGAPAVGLVAGPGGRCVVSVAVPLGRLAAARWRLLAELAARGGSGELRVTPWRGVVLPGFSQDGARAALRELADAGLVTAPHSPWLGVGACTGRPGCAKSLADVRADAARAVAGEASGGGRPGRPPTALPVYFSGCERRCGHPGGRWVDVLATGDGYQVTVRGATGSERGVDGTVNVTAEQLAGAVAAARGTT
ncbi:nitrite reductase [Streptomyces sp. ME19-01-6]|uniref:nitrite reductase n=1 Tax=Streptomyces sp. ME19-01-6 TaxID=3028686 RepID=UPI0029BF34A9|nr:nitrite reductase [Streptomyces sp. ME19-01-6]MDX3227807.1 nitrite reductase [Streptomyces sp. ME19-01-6]